MVAKTLSEFMSNHFSRREQYPTPIEIWNAATEAAELKCVCLQKRKAETCPKCHGTGDDPNWVHGSVGKCDACGGTGKRNIGTTSLKEAISLVREKAPECILFHHDLDEFLGGLDAIEREC